MKKLSAFDIGIMIAFVVITLLGGGVCYYLSGKLDDAKTNDRNASDEYDKYSTKQLYLPIKGNETTLQNNIDLMQGQLDPLVQNKLQPKDSKLAGITTEDPVTWKHNLDEQISRLNASARTHGVTVPPNFYYGFSRYLNPTPGEEQTIVLTKQLQGIEAIANILIGAPVKSIFSIRRTYEEDAASAGAPPSNGGRDVDALEGRAQQAPGDVYTSYPFDITFSSNTVALRQVFNQLTASPYIFVVRIISVENSRLDSPQVGDLDKMAGPKSAGVGDSSPGEVAADHSAKGPQFLFGNEILNVHMRIDLVEWHGLSADATTDAGKKNGRKGGNGARP